MKREIENMVALELDRMFRTAYGFLGNVHDSEDAVHDAVLRFYRRGGGFDPGRPLGPYLGRIVINVCMDMLNDPARGRRTLDASVGPAGAHERLSDDPELEGWLEKLDPSDRFVLDFYYREGLSVRALAEMLGEKTGTVKVRLHRARQRLKELMTKGQREKIANE